MGRISRQLFTTDSFFTNCARHFTQRKYIYDYLAQRVANSIIYGHSADWQRKVLSKDARLSAKLTVWNLRIIIKLSVSKKKPLWMKSKRNTASSRASIIRM